MTAVVVAIVAAAIVVVLGAHPSLGRAPVRQPATTSSHRGGSRRAPWRTRQRRHRPDEVEVAAWCDRVASGVRAGSSLTRAVTEADAVTPRDERPFDDVTHALARGRGLADALGEVTDGPDTPVGLLAPVLVASAELGGSAAGPLDRVGATLLARATEREERRASSAQAHLSARVLTILPFAVLGLLVVVEPSIRHALATPAGLICVTAGAAASALGWWWMRVLIGGGR